MALQVFDFEISKPYHEEFEETLDKSTANTGKDFARARADSDRFIVDEAHLIFPHIDGRTLRDFLTFYRAHRGPVKRFKYKAVYPENFVARDTATATASQTDFPLSFRYVDAANVVLKIDSVEDTNFTIQNNDTTTVLLRLDTPATGGEDIEITYHYYTPVRFRNVRLPHDYQLRTGDGYDNHAQMDMAFELVEADAGGRLVA